MPDEIPRYDLVVVSGRRSMRISPQGVRSVVMHLNANGGITEIMQTETKGWTEIHATPGEFAHSLFHEGASTGVRPVFYEMGIRFGNTPLEVGYELDPVYFFIEFRGLAFDCVTDEFLDRVDAILYCRPEVWLRTHEAMRGREYGPDDEPEARPKKRDRTDGRAGVRVEEL